jgi:hypothetical protein
LGAYERDNFGDILFLKVTEKLLAPWPVVPLSILSRDMHAEGAGTILSASAWFDCCQVEFLPAALIVVGGEVLNCPLPPAFQCDLDPSQVGAYSQVSADDHARIARAVAWRSGTLAYLPSFENLLDKRGTVIPLAINSVGGGDARPGTETFASALDVLQQARYVSIRDAVSHGVFSAASTHPELVRLDPDLVSALPLCCTPEVEEAYRRGLRGASWLTEPYLLIQLSDMYVSSTGPLHIAQAIARTAGALGLSIVLQPAGLAVSHDSFHVLDRIGELVRSEATGPLRVFTERNRDVWSQVATIAHAACYVGTSLHGRVVAAAFARPQVSLSNGKVANYGSTWDRDTRQPYGVLVENLPSAVTQAISRPPEELRAHANRQALRAQAAFDSLRHALQLEECPGDSAGIMDMVKACTERALLRDCQKLRTALVQFACENAETRVVLRNAQEALATAQTRTKDVEEQLAVVQTRASHAEGQLAAFERTWVWRVTALPRKLKRAIRRPNGPR